VAAVLTPAPLPLAPPREVPPSRVVRATTPSRRPHQFRLRQAPFGSRASVGAERSRVALCPFPSALPKQSSSAVAGSRARERDWHARAAPARQQCLLRASSALLRRRG